ncbi:sn-glycerol-3-phosphate ABC transporter ATP-binding protein UgpC [Paraburkholderia sp. CNPSo 3281]|uniref:ABC transporter ATP-binding protein n=1 Tax=Paraburkholderia sp. CNPSo 3281 TaxID=2940933 RepID=UPI0020B7D9A9|nr:sn-glycerol-3-phosphate ABC transporter ATP-binding protein UgpC [Paraburkholderia sp. CNPSo 3281]MCP3715862.1 sn-glycerol-3-phosphate ABC transporter ATP-binding protein UgpC [Paraburkholderia sp. CNPSo 3281]
MDRIQIERLSKSYGTVQVLKDIDISVPEGCFVALVGPSGCGKSTLLRTIAGLEPITGGTLRIDGQVVNDVPPRKRDVAMVFQSYALYPHMNIEKNMSYSLRLRRAAPKIIRESIDGVARTLGLDPLLARMPRQLSGGQRQRVAMGRAIVRNPKVFLFDEPLSNLDAALRVHMRTEIRKLHQRLAATSVYVTHDQIEAMTMADHVVVMRAGEVEQQGAPLALYHRPANRFVAGFIGSPSMNFIEAVIGPDGRSARFGGTPGAGAHTLDLGRALPAGSEVWIGLRPEHLQLHREAHGLRGMIDTVETTGSMNFIAVKLDGVPAPVMIAQAGMCAMRSGEAIGLDMASEHIHVFDRKTEQAL